MHSLLGEQGSWRAVLKCCPLHYCVHFCGSSGQIFPWCASCAISVWQLTSDWSFMYVCYWVFHTLGSMSGPGGCSSSPRSLTASQKEGGHFLELQVVQVWNGPSLWTLFLCDLPNFLDEAIQYLLKITLFSSLWNIFFQEEDMWNAVFHIRGDFDSMK